MEDKRFRLPELEFIGGSTKDLQFRALFSENHRPFDLSLCNVVFALVDVMDVGGEEPLISKEATIQDGNTEEDGLVSNMILVELTPAETAELNGKYIYQLTVKETATGKMEQYQGKMYIHGNVNRGYIMDA